MLYSVISEDIVWIACVSGGTLNHNSEYYWDLVAKIIAGRFQQVLDTAQLSTEYDHRQTQGFCQ